MTGHGPARPKTFAAGAMATTQTLYRGFTLRETTGAAQAVVRIWDNATAASGVLLDTIQLPQGTDDRALDPLGLWAQNGIFVEVVSGTVEGSLYIG